MIEVFSALSVLINIAILIIAVFLLKRKTEIDLSKIENRIDAVEKNQRDTAKTIRDELSMNRAEAAQNSRDVREELQNNLHNFSSSLANRMTEIAQLQKAQLDTFSQQLTTLTQSNERSMDKMRESVQERLKSIQEDTGNKLEQIRVTVDEKLHETLETRLGESFKIVGERLESVHKGLGEMRSLATGVGDLKKMLSNVKARGIWGEIHLGAIIEEILTPDQYDKNVATRKGSDERVEYAVKLPGRGDAKDQIVWLPIDAKFPQEDYARLIDAHDKGDLARAEEAHKQLAFRIKEQARSIRDKYINPPNTTDFAIMFLPTESLFAEALRFPGLCEELQQKYRVTIAGPTTLGALLNSLNIGFKTLVIEKRTSEVWRLLAGVRTQFSKFSELLDQTSKKLTEAGNKIDEASDRSRKIENRLRKVEALPVGESDKIFEDTEAN